jgi:pyruvate,water dikinase
MAMQEMFTLGERSSFPEGTTKKLNIPQPLDVYLIDLGKGLNEAKSLSSGVTPDDVKSRPFLALWKGMSQVTWAGPRPVSLRGFMSVVARSASDPTVMEKLTYKNYVIITDTYMNFSTRLGYHFSSIDAFIGENTQDNYVQFIFNGGGADLTRRMRRTRLISMILNHHGLNTILKEDNLYARGENLEAATIEKMLTVLGIVVVTTRQMDMAMYNDKIVDWYFQEFIKGNYFFGATSQK